MNKDQAQPVILFENPITAFKARYEQFDLETKVFVESAMIVATGTVIVPAVIMGLDAAIKQIQALP